MLTWEEKAFRRGRDRKGARVKKEMERKRARERTRYTGLSGARMMIYQMQSGYKMEEVVGVMLQWTCLK